MTLRSALQTLLACLIAASLVVSCDDEGGVDALLLEITSEAPLNGEALDGVRILFTDGETFLPVDASDSDFRFTPDDEVWSDPARSSFVVRIEYGGETFAGDEVTVHVTGWAKGEAVALYERTLRLDEGRVAAVHLRAVPEGCDGDRDGFMDCSVDGCCPAGADALADCEPDARGAHPFFFGAEVCDGLDNDCDGVTDNPFTTLGEACDSGNDDCMNGTVTCNEGGDDVQCLENQTFKEICGDGADNDCDGDIDEGC